MRLDYRAAMQLSTGLATALRRVPLQARVVASGAFAFAVCVLLPTLHRAERLPPSAFVLLALAPLCLVGGIALTQSRARASGYLLLTGFPTGIALSLSRFDHETALATFSPGAMAIALASLAAYIASAITLCSAPPRARAVDHKPLGEVAPVEPETRRQTFGHVVLAVVTLGALWLTLACSAGSPAELREHWGRASAEGATLTALVSGLVGAAALALVAPALRAERPKRQTPDDLRRRLSWLALVGISGLSVYALLRATQ